MKAVINKEVSPGECFFSLPLFESKPEPQIAFFSKCKVDYFVLHIDFEDEITERFPVCAKIFPKCITSMNDVFVRRISLDDDAIRSINNLYFELLDGGFAEGSVILNGVYL